MISELLDDSAPVLTETLQLLEDMRDKPKLAQDAIKQYIHTGRAHIDRLESETLDLFKPKKGRKPKRVSE